MYTLALRTSTLLRQGVLGKLNLTRNILCIFPVLLLSLLPSMLLLLSGCLRKMQFMCFAAWELASEIYDFSYAYREWEIESARGVCTAASLIECVRHSPLALSPAPSCACLLPLVIVLFAFGSGGYAISFEHMSRKTQASIVAPQPPLPSSPPSSITVTTTCLSECRP